MCGLWDTLGVSKSRAYWATKWSDLQSLEGTPDGKCLASNPLFLNQRTVSSRASADCSCHGVTGKERWTLGDSTHQLQTVTLHTLPRTETPDWCTYLALLVGNWEFRSHCCTFKVAFCLKKKKKKASERGYESFLGAELSAVPYVSKAVTRSGVFVNVNSPIRMSRSPVLC